MTNEQLTNKHTLKSWNWGAFFLTWIWGLGNKTYIGLSTFLAAFIFFVIAFVDTSQYLEKSYQQKLLSVLLMIWFGYVILMHVLHGIKGNRWAWKNKQWHDIQHFRHVQKKWAIAAITIIITLITLITVSFIGLNVYVKKSEIYRNALTLALQNKILQTELGTPLTSSYSITSGAFKNLSDNKVIASYLFKLYGPNKTAIIGVTAIKIRGVWILEQESAFIPQNSERGNIVQIDVTDTNKKILETKAQQGNVDAQYLLGETLMEEKKYTKAGFWLQKAVDQGDAFAANNLAILYGHGNGVEKNIAKTLELYKMAAAKGDYAAMYNIGLTYGRNATTPNYVEAAKWFKKSIDTKPHACPLNDLGMLYAAGEGVEQDNYEANKLFRQAAKDLFATDKEIFITVNRQLKKLTRQKGFDYLEEITNAFADYQFALSIHENPNKISDEYSANAINIAILMSKKVETRCWE